MIERIKNFFKSCIRKYPRFMGEGRVIGIEETKEGLMELKVKISLDKYITVVAPKKSVVFLPTKEGFYKIKGNYKIKEFDEKNHFDLFYN